LELERAEGKKEPSEARTALAVKLNPNPVVRRQKADRKANQTVKESFDLGHGSNVQIEKLKEEARCRTMAFKMPGVRVIVLVRHRNSK